MKYLFFISLFVFSCSSENVNIIENDKNNNSCINNAIVKNKVFVNDHKKYLWAGNDSTWQFDITDWSLNECQLSNGLFGRESFSALLQPMYISIKEVQNKYSDKEKCIILKGQSIVKVYPYQTIQVHEVINDTIDTHPIMVAYCFLADLAAVYTREYCDTVLTFALSGYTYHDDNVWGGLDGFLLWDRDTESLWWPLVDQAVSGSLKEVRLQKHDQSTWETISWGDVKKEYPEALILQQNQTMDIPEDWNRLSLHTSNCY